MPPPKRKTRPLAPPPTSISRKRARQVTSEFHKLTQLRDESLRRGESTQEVDDQLVRLGGRREYQRASMVSTRFFSTSKWVLGYLASNGWLYGIRTTGKERRPTDVLEIGSINTELLDAGAAQVVRKGNRTRKYLLQVRALDIHSNYDGIEEADFLEIPLDCSYDVIVCSMVLNCVTTPEDRGDMLARIYHFLKPGGIVFLTIPKTCLQLSPFLDRDRFIDIVQAVGLVQVTIRKDSPKIAFFVFQRPQEARNLSESIDMYSVSQPWRRGKKFQNKFAVTLTREAIDGSKWGLDQVDGSS